MSIILPKDYDSAEIARIISSEINKVRAEKQLLSEFKVVTNRPSNGVSEKQLIFVNNETDRYLGIRDRGEIHYLRFEQSTAAPTAGDKVGVDSAATPDYLGATGGTGAFRTGSGLSYADGGNFVTIAVDADYADISGNDGATDVTATELEELSDGSETTLHKHASTGVGIYTYKGISLGAHTFGSGDFSDVPALTNTPLVLSVVVGDGAAGINNLSNSGFTLFDRGIGSIDSVDIVVFSKG